MKPSRLVVEDILPFFCSLKWIMRAKKGRFVSKKAHVRGLLSSARLKNWHNVLSDKSETSFSDSVIDVCQLCEPTVGETLTDSPEIGADVNYVPQDVLTGRRIVELGHLSNQLKMCSNCQYELSLSNAVQETRYGFGSVLSVMCRFCGSINNIETSKRHRHDGSKRGPKTFVVNTKAVVGK